MRQRLATLLLLLSCALVSTDAARRIPSSQPASGAADPLAELRRAFDSPPDDSRIMMRWWWFGPAVTKPQLARELQLMKAGGIGGVEIQPVYPVTLDDASTGIKNFPFLSDEFLDALKFTADTAHDLGVRVDLTLGSGWPYGGPQVPIAEAAGRLRYERVAIPAGARRVALPDIGAGEKLVAIFLAKTNGEAIVPDSLREIGDLEVGMVRLPASLDGPHALLVFIAGRTGMMVKRASIGAEGYVLDHYDRGALDRYLKEVGDRLMRGFGPRPPFAIFCDSLEVFQSDWTGDLLQAFQQRRGYDLRPHLPALVADVGPHTNAIRHDWGQTLTELLGERFLAPMKDWSAKHGAKFRVQGYGIPPATLSSNVHADLPEGEGWQWRTLTSSRWAASASHIYGRPVSSSETWTWLHSPSFAATPLDMKAEADLHFLQGVTQLIGHGWPYTAAGAEYPGWRFYAAAVFNDSNPWWIVMPDVSRYLQRVTFMLRQGAPANDVALYLPNSDAWAHFSASRVHMIETLRERLGPNILGHIFDAGYNVELIDDDALKAVGRVESGALVLGGNRYRVVVLPGVERLPLETVRMLDEFARGGGTVIATRRRPSLAPNFRATDADHAQVRDTMQRVIVGDRFVEDERQIGRALTAALQPDVQLSPKPNGQSVADIGAIHRRTPFADIYFVANTSNVAQRTTATFRVSRPHAAWWDPMTGAVVPIGLDRATRSVALDLAPYESRLIVFSDRPSPVEPTAPAASGTNGTRLTRMTPTAPRRAPAAAASSSGAAAATAIDLSTDWRVTFTPPPPGAGSGTAALTSSPAPRTSLQRVSPMTLDRLRSWTEAEATRDFSGVATYEKELTMPASMLKAGRALWLDFGETTTVQPTPAKVPRQRAWLEAPIREAAIVFINDRRVAAIWSPPYRLDVSGFLQPGPNRVRILVGNLAINYMAARPLPSYRLLNLRYTERFTPQDMDNLQPLPAGLLGPVRLIPGDSPHGRH